MRQIRNESDSKRRMLDHTNPASAPISFTPRLLYSIQMRCSMAVDGSSIINIK
jgi:hypothetical protein